MAAGSLLLEHSAPCAPRASLEWFGPCVSGIEWFAACRNWDRKAAIQYVTEHDLGHDWPADDPRTAHIA
jgi:hypothetical protein